MSKRTDNFDKFLPGKKNAAIKEQFRQEKKQWKKDRAAEIEKQKQRKLEADTPQPIVVKKKPGGEQMPLNKFIAHSGVCARREAALMVKDGIVTVNGTQILEPGFKVTPKDEVKVNGKKVNIVLDLVYILLNKPKDYLTTAADPEGRKTVLDLVKNASKDRVFPVGRLDRNTTGVLLLTNDGELAQKLSHPSNEVRKVYEVRLDRPVARKDMDEIAKGLTLDDGFIKPDAVAYADAKDKSVIGIEIHSGRNRIVRRIFEHIGYDVRNLDRVMFAGLTKKNVDRGKWRYLSEKEVRALKYFGAGSKSKGKMGSAPPQDVLNEDAAMDMAPRGTAPKPKAGEQVARKREGGREIKLKSKTSDRPARRPDTEKRVPSKVRTGGVSERKPTVGNRAPLKAQKTDRTSEKPKARTRTPLKPRK